MLRSFILLTMISITKHSLVTAAPPRIYQLFCSYLQQELFQSFFGVSLIKCGFNQTLFRLFKHGFSSELIFSGKTVRCVNSLVTGESPSPRDSRCGLVTIEFPIINIVAFENCDLHLKYSSQKLLPYLKRQRIQFCI